jgi:hypothetical protein
MSRHPQVDMNQGPSYNEGAQNTMWHHHNHHSHSIPHESNNGPPPREFHPQQRYGSGPNQPYLRPYEHSCPQPDEHCSQQVTPTAENRWIHHLTYETPDSHVDRFYGHQARPEVDNLCRFPDMSGGNVTAGFHQKGPEVYSRFKFHEMAHGNTLEEFHQIGPQVNSRFHFHEMEHGYTLSNLQNMQRRGMYDNRF